MSVYDSMSEIVTYIRDNAETELEYLEQRKQFLSQDNCEFVESTRAFYELRGEISPRQARVIFNIKSLLRLGRV